MATSAFDSSDSQRHARPLKHAQYVTFDEPMHLEKGGVLPAVTVAYETYGELSPDRDNAILICHALSGDSHVARHSEDDDPGWWDLIVGPGKPIDTDRFFVICPNLLGGCRGTTGPNSINPVTGKPYGPDFPLITVGDMVHVQQKLVDHLGIDRLLAVLGGSLGGHVTLQWATQLPERLRGAGVIASSARLTSQALAFDVVGRNAILRDPHYESGQYYDHGPGPQVGLAIARMLAHITYLSRESMTRKFDADRNSPRDIPTQFETRFSVGSYLAYQGDRFVERFDANSYLTLTMALDMFDLGPTTRALEEALSGSQCRWLVLSFTSDWLYPAFQSREIVEALIRCGKRVSYCNVESDCGHDAFLLPNDLDVYGEMIRVFLNDLSHEGEKHVEWCAGPTDWCNGERLRPTSIFFDRDRLDYDLISELIPPEAAVLDLGCGDGGLLAQLRQRGHDRIMGIELDEQAILTCICRGLDVIQSDLNEGLSIFSDRQFDFVVLSQTLQTVTDVTQLVKEMLRVGRYGIVSFPNLGYEPYRRQLLEKGVAPRIGAGEGYRWYDTPNLRFLSISDFEEFCQSFGFRIHKKIAMDTTVGHRVSDDLNLRADLAIMVLSR